MKKLEVDKDYSSEKIWSFDLGIASIGYAIRGYNEDSPIDFQEVKSLIIPAEFASIKDQSIRRRAFRTRSAHKAREEYLISFFEKLRLPVLKGRRVAKIEGKWQLVSLGDNYLEREFPAPGENTVYNSALLRIQLIEGVPMAPWQIFKAFYSAIQKRGYDSKVPWRTSYKNDDNNENSKTTQKANAMEQFIQATFAQDKQYPCYWEAWRMKLWTPEEGIVSLRINHHAQNIKEESSQCNESSPPLPAIYPCNLVENELRALYKEAEKQLPALKGKVNEFLFGIGEKRYASYLAQHCDKELRQELLNKGIKLIPGKETDRQGVLSQKIPTFDNRCPENCKLIPRFHVAKRAAKIVQEQLLESSLLPAELSFLMQLKNIRFRMIEDKEGFNAEEIRAIFQEVRSAALLKNDPEKIVKTFKLTHKELNTYAKKLRRITLEKSMEIVAPSTSGRSRFSKPALLLLKEIILSGKSPEEFRQYLEEEGTILARYRLSLNDISIFSSERMGETWEQLYIPDASLSESLNCLGQDKSTRMKAIQALIGKQLDPIIRDRLFRIVRLISSLEERFGTPDRIVLEFVRDDFLGAKAKMKLAQRQRDNYRRNMKNLTKSRGDFKLAFKHKLWKEQGGICPFTGKPISLDEIQNDGVHIDHIVPRAMGGPNAH